MIINKCDRPVSLTYHQCILENLPQIEVTAVFGSTVKVKMQWNIKKLDHAASSINITQQRVIVRLQYSPTVKNLY